MSALETYIKPVLEQKGMAHLNALKSLRWYIRISDETELIKAIEHINNLDYLRILVEAGLKPRLMDAVTTRHDDLTKRMAGVR